MPMSRGELKGKVLRLLMKTAQYPGFYKDETINDAIDEAMDFVATEMFIADEGWQAKIMPFDTVAGQIKVDLPEGFAMIKEVRYLYADLYIPMVYDDGSKEVQYANDSGVRQWAYSYRIVDNAIWFNPPMADGGTDYLQIEYMGYPKKMQSDSDFMESHFDNAMQHFMKYRVASILAASIEKFVVPWAGLEQDWFKKMRDIVVKRNMQATAIKEFAGY
jgi:hypothetical protein